jgi:heat shock protein HtpX
MTVASFAGIVAGLLTRMWMWGGLGRRRDDSNAALVFLAILVVSVVVYAVSFLLTRALSRYRELAADRGGALLTGHPAALGSALQKISGDMAAIPDRDLREVESVSAFFFAPAFVRAPRSPPVHDAPAAGEAARAARAHLRRARPPRPGLTPPTLAP